MQDRIIINDYIQGDPLSEENLDKTLLFLGNLKDFQKVDPANPLKSRVSEVENTDKIRLSYGRKNIWLYTGFRWEDIWSTDLIYEDGLKYFSYEQAKRQDILKQVDVVVDGRYIDSQRDITLKWRGSSNQRVINIPESLKQGKVITLV